MLFLSLIMFHHKFYICPMFIKLLIDSMTQDSTGGLPPDIQAQLVQISQKTSKSLPSLREEYWRIFEKAQIDASMFKSATPEYIERFRHQMAIGKMWKDAIYRWPQEDVTFVYLGHGGLRIARSSKVLYSDLFIIVPDKQGSPKICRVQARGERAEIFRELNQFGRYRANLSKHPQSMDYRIEADTVLEFLAQVSLPIDEFNRQLGIPVVKVSEAANYVSKKQGKYTDMTDWRCIFGMFGGEPRTGDRKDGKTQYGVFNIIDETCNKEIRKDPKTGRDIYPGMSTWVAPEHLVYTPDSFCAFYGTIDINPDTKEPFMNCYMIVPIGAKLREPVVEDAELEEYE